MMTESHPGAIWNKERRLKTLATFEARERQARRQLRKSMRQTIREMSQARECQAELLRMIFRSVEVDSEPLEPGQIPPVRVN